MNQDRDGELNSILFERLRHVSISARKLFAVVLREAYHGPIHPKNEGVATPPEILEGCGLDVGEFYGLVDELKGAGLIEVANQYPFEEIRISPQASQARSIAERCADTGWQLEHVFANLTLPPGV